MFKDLLNRSIIFICETAYLAIINLRIDIYQLLLKMAKHEYNGFHAMMTRYEEIFDDKFE